MYEKPKCKMDTITFLEENMLDSLWHKFKHYFFGPIS